MKFWIFFGGGFVAWYLFSQLIAWMITPGQNEDEVVETWAAVFLAPVAIVYVAVDMALNNLLRFINRTFFAFLEE